jgi:hypothetical protein
MSEVTASQGRRPAWHLLLPLLVGLLVAETLGLLAREASSGNRAYFQLFFSDTLHLKSWCATAALVLACAQLFTAAWVFRKLPWPRPPAVNVVHRWTGRLAFALTIPVAYHCVFKLGFQTGDTRVAAHAFFGVAFFGALATKVLVLRMHRFHPVVLPLVGGLVFAALVGAWWTSALWFFRLVGEGI